MTDFLKILGETKSQLKGMLTQESSQEQINLIADLDKKLDELQEAFNQKTQENESLKNDLIASVKSTGFKVNGNSGYDEDIQGETPKSLDEIMVEELQKYAK